jgi:hypothetical protein
MEVPLIASSSWSAGLPVAVCDLIIQRLSQQSVVMLAQVRPALAVARRGGCQWRGSGCPCLFAVAELFSVKKSPQDSFYKSLTEEDRANLSGEARHPSLQCHDATCLLASILARESCEWAPVSQPVHVRWRLPWHSGDSSCALLPPPPSACRVQL